MSYYFAKTLSAPFDDVVDRVIASLKAEGFGVLTTIDVQATLKEKLGVEFPRYLILGACNPTLAHQALQAESKIGTMLPCNVIVRDDGDGKTEVAAVDPVSSMQAVKNPALEPVAAAVRQKLNQVVQSLQAAAR
ncbi:DUF302 domain-containing protein [Woeseia oceani]|uniref:DUF302 domain-containing protein n=1 Tax=Woeseia oceani TaxID=1548547 RepID=A0A193LLB4_9GAMM|nr:DUF302 domain-containing protein [Woeseia oceani]ANO53213.1 hypothetical protein BA177_12710 [Woeseia oceani]